SSFLVENIASIQSQYDLRSDYTKAAAYAIAEAIDSDIAKAMTASFSGFGAYGTALNDNLILTVNRYLSENKAPRTERYIVVHPKGEQEMLAIDKYVRYDSLGQAADQNPTKTGKIGQLYGAEVFMSQNLVYL